MDDFACVFWRIMFSREMLSVINELFSPWIKNVFALDSQYTQTERAVHYAKEATKLKMDLSIVRSEIEMGHFVINLHPFSDKNICARLPTEYQCPMYIYLAVCICPSLFSHLDGGDSICRPTGGDGNAFLRTTKSMGGAVVKMSHFKYNVDLQLFSFFIPKEDTKGVGALLLYLRCLMSTTNIFTDYKLLFDMRECIYDMLDAHNLLGIFDYLGKDQFIQKVSAHFFFEIINSKMEMNFPAFTEEIRLKSSVDRIINEGRTIPFETISHSLPKEEFKRPSARQRNPNTRWKEIEIVQEQGTAPFLLSEESEMNLLSVGEINLLPADEINPEIQAK